MTTYRRITSLVTIAGVFALAATPAVAQPFGGHTGGSYVRQEKQLVGPSSASPSPTIVRLSPASSGFDWGDAGLGAAGGFALSMLAIGGVLAVTQRRGRRDQTVLSS